MKLENKELEYMMRMFADEQFRGELENDIIHCVDGAMKLYNKLFEASQKYFDDELYQEVCKQKEFLDNMFD